MNREGFWRQYERRNDKDDYARYPWPMATDIAWLGKREFLIALRALEQTAMKIRYKGHSSCRICGKSNGSVEHKANGWLWPEGYIHYVEEHNVRPSLAFQEMVLVREVDK